MEPMALRNRSNAPLGVLPVGVFITVYKIYKKVKPLIEAGPFVGRVRTLLVTAAGVVLKEAIENSSKGNFIEGSDLGDDEIGHNVPVFILRAGRRVFDGAVTVTMLPMWERDP